MTDGAPPPERHLALALAARQGEGASGILRATRGRLKRLFCLDQGWIAFAASNLIEEQFAEVLVQKGVLSPSARVEILDEASRKKAKFGSVLEMRRIVPRDALREAMERHVEALLSSCLEWPDAVVTFDGGTPELAGEITVRLAPIPLILKHARRYPVALDALRVRIGPPDLRPVRSAAMALVAATVETDAAGRFVLDRADGTMTVGQIANASGAGEEPALRAIYGLLLAGLIEPPAERAAAKRSEPALTRQEVEARLAVSGAADHYAVLGLDRSASRTRIRDAYYALARRYHPDRFRSGPLKGLREQVERYFTQVTEAYNTLFYPDRRAEYDAQFGAAMQPDAARTGDTAYLARQNFLRGRQLAERKRLGEALTFLDNAVSLDESVAEYHLELGLLLAKSARRREDAEQQLIAAAQIDPSLAAAYLGLGHLYQRAGRDGDAARMLREVLRWEPGNAEAAALLASLGATPEDKGPGEFLRAVLKG